MRQALLFLLQQRAVAAALVPQPLGQVAVVADAQRQALKTAMTAITNSDPTVQARTRAQTALYIVATSPQFQVDR